MTIKQMFKKIETYNEIAEIVKGEKLKIHITLGYCGEYFNDYASFKKYAKQNYADDLIKALNGCADFTFGEAHKLTFTCYGDAITETVEINAYSF